MCHNSNVVWKRYGSKDCLRLKVCSPCIALIDIIIRYSTSTISWSSDICFIWVRTILLQRWFHMFLSKLRNQMAINQNWHSIMFTFSCMQMSSQMSNPTCKVKRVNHQATPQDKMPCHQRPAPWPSTPTHQAHTAGPHHRHPLALPNHHGYRLLHHPRLATNLLFSHKSPFRWWSHPPDFLNKEFHLIIYHSRDSWCRSVSFSATTSSWAWKRTSRSTYATGGDATPSGVDAKTGLTKTCWWGGWSWVQEGISWGCWSLVWYAGFSWLPRSW